MKSVLNVCSTFSGRREEQRLAQGLVVTAVAVALDTIARVHIHGCGVQVLFLTHEEDIIEVFEDKVKVIREVRGGAVFLG